MGDVSLSALTQLASVDLSPRLNATPLATAIWVTIGSVKISATYHDRASAHFFAFTDVECQMPQSPFNSSRSGKIQCAPGPAPWNMSNSRDKIAEELLSPSRNSYMVSHLAGVVLKTEKWTEKMLLERVLVEQSQKATDRWPLAGKFQGRKSIPRWSKGTIGLKTQVN